MKNLILIPFFFASCLAVNAQTVAADWTQTDCDGVSHNLFTYLDNEEVVIMAFAMGCASCYDAGPALIGKRNDYAVSHPGKVKAFYMDYWAGNDCAADILPNVGMYDYDGIIAHCNTEKTYYFDSAVPMPGIVIAAGSNHDIIYQSMSFIESDTLEIQQAIDSFFMTVSVKAHQFTTPQVNVYPNPASSMVTIQLNGFEPGTYTISLFDATGKLSKVYHQAFMSNTSAQFDIHDLPKGLYNVNVSINHTLTSQKLLIE
ncbi:MAG TPA: T9SS type A sorting domain-containing protein [Flavobacteriales bacterium]|nr:T9SS type A sorting domain-containing protein [Flavobacteriales bacterium]